MQQPTIQGTNIRANIVVRLIMAAPTHRAASIHAALHEFPPRTSRAWRPEPVPPCPDQVIPASRQCETARISVARRETSPAVPPASADPSRALQEFGPAVVDLKLPALEARLSRFAKKLEPQLSWLAKRFAKKFERKEERKKKKRNPERSRPPAASAEKTIQPQP